MNTAHILEAFSKIICLHFEKASLESPIKKSARQDAGQTFLEYTAGTVVPARQNFIFWKP